MNRLTKLTMSLGACALTNACTSTPEEPVELSGSGMNGEVHWLFVQGASSGSFAGDTLVLENPAPTVFFSDRPVRIDGHMSTERFVDAWGRGDDSFRDDPPNAVLSILGDDPIAPAVVELSEPALEGDQLRFRVTVLSGRVPAGFGQAALFIDSLGLAGPTLGLDMNDAANGALRHPRLDLAAPHAYYRTFAPNEADPLNPNLVPRDERGEGYKWAYERDSAPDLELASPHIGLTPYYGD